MDTVTEKKDIVVLDFPIEANYGQWAIDHPECDTVYEQIGTSSTILVYAYSLSKGGNKNLHRYRDEFLEGKKILMGVSLDGIRSII